MVGGSAMHMSFSYIAVAVKFDIEYFVNYLQSPLLHTYSYKRGDKLCFEFL